MLRCGLRSPATCSLQLIAKFIAVQSHHFNLMENFSHGRKGGSTDNEDTGAISEGVAKAVWSYGESTINIFRGLLYEFITMIDTQSGYGLLFIG